MIFLGSTISIFWYIFGHCTVMHELAMVVFFTEIIRQKKGENRKSQKRSLKRFFFFFFGIICVY